MVAGAEVEKKSQVNSRESQTLQDVALQGCVFFFFWGGGVVVTHDILN